MTQAKKKLENKIITAQDFMVNLLQKLITLLTNLNQKKKFPIFLTDYNNKINETEGKIPIISGLATTSALTAVENKILNVSNLVKKQIIMQKLLKFKRNLLIMIMLNILLLLSLISFQQKFLMQD